MIPVYCRFRPSGHCLGTAMRCIGFVLVVLLAASSAQQAPAEVPAFDILEADILQLQVAMGTGQLTARALVDYYLSLIHI